MNLATIENIEAIKHLLDERFVQYNHLDFIESDPIHIPHLFGIKEEIEIAGFLTATIAWGQRPTIIKNARRLMRMMDDAPFSFVMNASSAEIDSLSSFVHRTFNGGDLAFFIRSLHNIYSKHGGLEQLFTDGFRQNDSVLSALTYFRKVFIESPHEKRSEKHLSDVSRNSSAKRLNMYLRWMVRSDDGAVDFGLWKDIPTSALMLPLDVHTGDVGRALGILNRKNDDWKAVEEITEVLRSFDPNDPIKYDFALFGIGAFGDKKNISLR